MTSTLITTDQIVRLGSRDQIYEPGLLLLDDRWLFRAGTWTTLDYLCAVRQLEKDHRELVNRMEAAG